MAKSLNKVILIGNLTRDPELRYTPQGTAVCTFGLATNRQWVTETGEKREEADFHRLVAWNKLADGLCSAFEKRSQGLCRRKGFRLVIGRDRMVASERPRR